MNPKTNTEATLLTFRGRRLDFITGEHGGTKAGSKLGDPSIAFESNQTSVAGPSLDPCAAATLDIWWRTRQVRHMCTGPVDPLPGGAPGANSLDNLALIRETRSQAEL